MGSFVVRQTDTLTKRFAAHVTHKRSFIGVGSAVTVKGSGLVKVLVTYVTLVGPVASMNSGVYGEISLTAESLPAYFARVRFPWFESTMRALVLVEVGGSAELFLANVALVSFRFFTCMDAFVPGEADEGAKHAGADVARV